jgi:hypothetical protein
VWDIDETTFFSTVSAPCTYCGSAGENTSQSYGGRKQDDYNYTGIDRVDNNIGYVVSNIVPCCSMCNYMKKDTALPVWLNHIRKVLKYYDP